MDPEILIYDEPFVGLDPISMGVILRLIRRLNDALGLTSIVVSHDVQEISSVADAVFLLSGGKVVAHGTPQELQSYPSEIVRQFMGGLADGPVPFHYPAGRLFHRTARSRRAGLNMLRDVRDSLLASLVELGDDGAVPAAAARLATPQALLRFDLVIEQIYNAGALSLVIIITVGPVRRAWCSACRDSSCCSVSAPRTRWVPRLRSGWSRNSGRWSRRCCSPAGRAPRWPRSSA